MKSTATKYRLNSGNTLISTSNRLIQHNLLDGSPNEGNSNSSHLTVKPFLTSIAPLKRVFFGFLFLALFLGASTNGWGQTGVTAQIGSGTATSPYMPIHPYYGYTYSQSIYTSAELSAAGAVTNGYITKIRYNVKRALDANSTGWTVYLGNTTKTSFTNTTNWVTIANLTQVYTGTVSTGTGWIEITLDTPFQYTGNNLVVAVDENTPGYTSSSNTDWFYGYTGATNRGIYYYNDGTNPNPSSPPTGTRVSVLPQIQFFFPNYAAQTTSVNYGSSPWCIGETRNVSITVKNVGSRTWYASGSTNCASTNLTVAASFKWNADAGFDSYTTPPFSNRNPIPSDVAPGSAVTITFPVTTPNGDPTGANNLSINLIAQECEWFSPVVYTSPSITINPLPVISPPATTMCPNGTMDLSVPGEWASLPTNATPIAGANPNNEYYSQFNTSGTFTSPATINNATVLVVAGGGGGGTAACNVGAPSAGGAGGLLYSTLSIASGTTVTVGNGGGANSNGGNSKLNTLTAIGGGRGGYGDNSCNLNAYLNGASGGSGGSNACYYNTVTTTGAGTVGQGNAGGLSPRYSTYTNYVSAGGGGAGASGTAPTAAGTPGEGGIGLQYSITGIPTYYAGGGGGYAFQNNSTGSAGLGAIGQGGTAGGAGNSGTVIIRYRVPKYTLTHVSGATGTTINALTGVITAGSVAGTISVTYTNEFGCTSDAVVITVQPIPSATLVTASSTICHGNTVTLSGTVSSGGTVTINNGVGAATTSGTTWSAVVTPTATTTYAIASVTNAGCTGTGSGSTTVTLPTAGTTLSQNGESATCIVNGTNIINFYHSSGRLIASINPNGQNLGSVTATSYVDAGLAVPACGDPTNPNYVTATMGRHWVIKPTNQPASAVLVGLPFSPSEYSSVAAASLANANPNDNLTGLASLKLSKYSGTNEDGLFSNNCGNGTTTLWDQSSSGNVTAYIAGFNASDQFAAFSIPSFSEFWLHGQTSSPLPVKLTNFSATCEKVVTLNWTTASEQNSDRFIVEKSRDGQTWSWVATQTAAGNSNTTLHYTQTDENSWNGLTYYRLRQVDFNGDQEVYGPISVSCEGNENSMTVYPNPNSGSFTVEIASEETYADAQLVVTDMSGKVINTQKVSIAVGTTQILFEGLALEMGTYLISVRGVDQSLRPVKVVISY